MYHGSADKVLPVMASLGHKCPVNFNPADYMVRGRSGEEVGTTWAFAPWFHSRWCSRQ